MKYNFKKDQCVYYIDWQNNNVKIPAVIKTTRRTRADVLLKLDKPFTWQLADVPMEDLEATDDFTVNRHSLIGMGITWN